MKRNNSYLKGNQFAKGNSPNQTSFKRGDTPWNKNKKGIHLSPKSEFKKGSVPKNWVKVGTIKVRIDHKKRQARERKWIKIGEPNKWILYANYVWIKNKGKINKGMLIHHKDENTLNDNIGNLQQLSRKDHINIHRKELMKSRQNSDKARLRA